MKRLIFLIFSVFSIIPMSSQIAEETLPPNFIRTIRLFGDSNSTKGNPAIPINGVLNLTFDDIIGDEADYYYRIEHFDYNWQPTQLSKNEYLDGLDDIRVMNYQNSYNTLQPYSHYQLQIPNQYTKALKVSGNYMIKIYNENDELVFSRKFMVYESKVSVAAAIKRTRDLNYINTKQVINFKISSPDLLLRNPDKTVKPLIIQNHNLKSAIKDIEPQYTVGNELIYRYDLPTSFWGGNEYLQFDTKDLRATTADIGKVDIDELYNHYLNMDVSRESTPYTYNPDINGGFVVRQLNADNSNIEAEYTWIHFTLKNYEPINNGTLHIYGNFNNFTLDNSTALRYNEETGYYETARLFKQGFYNYKYVLVNKDGSIDEGFISGNYDETENEYTVLVYYREIGGRYDRIIGLGSANSSNISN
ncbi:type IX secretion system plug protein [Zunongwangia sp. HRR-M8]|uniref:type IX secretion system plug protein n=1 Tax=Zunongwangia sp. HRR-M8 TaxID=3015170 RepID=UPI003FCE0D0A